MFSSLLKVCTTLYLFYLLNLSSDLDKQCDIILSHYIFLIHYYFHLLFKDDVMFFHQHSTFHYYLIYICFIFNIFTIFKNAHPSGNIRNNNRIN